MLKDYMGILTLTENEIDVRNLTYNRPLAAIPIGGRYRIIDFILSNMVNAGIQNVGVFTQSNSRSLIDHLGTGKPWDLDRNIDGLFVFNFNINGNAIYDVKMLKNNMEYLYRSKQKNVILAPSYMICKIDYREVIKNHEASGKDITVIYKKINRADINMLNCDALNIGENKKLISVGTNVGVAKEANICMEMFIMKKQRLIELMYKSIQTGYEETLKSLVYQSVAQIDINTYEYKGYLECVNSISNYYKANMDMLDLEVIEEIFYKNGRIYTKVKNEPPTKHSKSAIVTNSIVSNGCIIEGNIENSIISRQVIVSKGAVIKNSIIHMGCKIGENAYLNNVIVDKGVVIKKDAVLQGIPEVPLTIEKKSIINSYTSI